MIPGGHTLNNEPMIDKMTIANSDMTMLRFGQYILLSSSALKISYHDHAFIAETTGLTILPAFAIAGCIGEWMFVGSEMSSRAEDRFTGYER